MFKLKITNNHALMLKILEIKDNKAAVTEIFKDIIDPDRYPYLGMCFTFNGLEIYFDATYPKRHKLIEFDALSSLFPNTEFTCQFRLWDTQIGESHYIDIQYTLSKGWEKYKLAGFEAEMDEMKYLGEEWYGYSTIESEPVLGLRTLILTSFLKPHEENILNVDHMVLNKLRLNPNFDSLKKTIHDYGEWTEEAYNDGQLNDNPFQWKVDLLLGVIIPSSKEKVEELGKSILENRWSICSAFYMVKPYNIYQRLSVGKYDKILYDYYKDNFIEMNNEFLDEYILNDLLNSGDYYKLGQLPSRFNKYEIINILGNL